MKTTVPQLACLLPGLALLASAQTGTPAPSKVGIIHIVNAIVSTRDGQKAFTELQAKFDPRRKDLERKQNEINALRDQMQRGANTMSDEAKQKIVRDIDQKTRAFNRETEDAQADYDQEVGKIQQELGQRIMAVLDKYARDNGYALILDVSQQQQPVLYAANGIDITNDIVGLYDKNAPSASAAPAMSRPASPPASAMPKPLPRAKPATPPAAPPLKKQP